MFVQFLSLHLISRNLNVRQVAFSVTSCQGHFPCPPLLLSKFLCNFVPCSALGKEPSLNITTLVICFIETFANLRERAKTCSLQNRG